MLPFFGLKAIAFGTRSYSMGGLILTVLKVEDIFLIALLSLALITAAKLPFAFVTYILLSSELKAMLPGAAVPDIFVRNLFVFPLITETPLLSPLLTIYILPFIGLYLISVGLRPTLIVEITESANAKCNVNIKGDNTKNDATATMTMRGLS
jgi:hypothetical protein